MPINVEILDGSLMVQHYVEEIGEPDHLRFVSKHILGAAILGIAGDEVVHVLLDVMYAKAPYTVVQRAMHIHPTVAEFLPTVLSKLEPFA